MFGYVTIAAGSLSEEQHARYRAHYCGLCHTLGERYGGVGRMTLSYDMTFLYMLLSSLYEPESKCDQARCLPHPFKQHGYVQNKLAEYCCDMNIALAYHKCLDDWQDDHSVVGRAEAALLQSSYRRVYALYPQKCDQIEHCLKEMAELEKRGEESPDALANLTAQMLGSLYRYQDDLWADTLEQVGAGLGRFIYVMDAYDDLESDIRKARYNPLRTLRDDPHYEELIKDSLTLMIAEATEAFETLPLVQDMDILRNILYAGCWTRYQLKKQKREQAQNLPVQRKHKAAGNKEDGA